MTLVKISIKIECTYHIFDINLNDLKIRDETNRISINLNLETVFGYNTFSDTYSCVFP